jgi:Fur family peroxide stress response transcriptional regulator
MMLTSEAIRELFRQRSVRHTRQREVVYAALATTKAHPTADELYHSVCRSHCIGAAIAAESELSLATVYNTLEALCEAGLAHRLPSISGPCRFDADTSSHAHLLAADGQVVDIPEDLSQQLLGAIPQSALDELAQRMGISIDRVTLQVVAKR